MAEQGWYLDPGGQRGMYRYWDGHTWSETLSPTPLSGPPLGFGASPLAGSQGNQAYDQYTSAARSKKSPAGWILAIVGVVVVALIIWFVVGLFRGVDPVDPTQPVDPVPTGEVCPKQPFSNSRVEHPNDDRVYGGDLSYPRLGYPFDREETEETRVPFGRDVAQQWYINHPEWPWGAGVLVGELYAGDGFYEPEEASRIVNQCIFGVFYGDYVVYPDTMRSEPHSVDGYDGWLTETMLTFSIPNLSVTSEWVVVIIVQTSAMHSSIFYSSIPGDILDLEPDIWAAVADLRVHA